MEAPGRCERCNGPAPLIALNGEWLCLGRGRGCFDRELSRIGRTVQQFVDERHHVRAEADA